MYLLFSIQLSSYVTTIVAKLKLGTFYTRNLLYP